MSQYKYLGLVFAKNLSRSYHIELMCNRVLRWLGYLQHTLCSAPSNTRLLTYKTLVRPILEYSSVRWNPHKISDIKKTESVQKTAIRFIYRRNDRHFSPSSHLHSLQLTSLCSRRHGESLHSHSPSTVSFTRQLHHAR